MMLIAELFRLNLKDKGYTYIAYQGRNEISSFLDEILPDPDPRRQSSLSAAMAYRDRILSLLTIAVINKLDVEDEHQRRGITLTHVIVLKNASNADFLSAYSLMRNLYADAHRFKTIEDRARLLAAESADVHDLKSFLTDLSIDQHQIEQGKGLAEMWDRDLTLHPELPSHGIRFTTRPPFDDDLAFAAAANHCCKKAGPFLVVLGKPKSGHPVDIICGSQHVHGFRAIDFRASLGLLPLELDAKSQSRKKFIFRRPSLTWIIIIATLVVAIGYPLFKYLSRNWDDQHVLVNSPVRNQGIRTTDNEADLRQRAQLRMTDLLWRINLIYPSKVENDEIHLSIPSAFPNASNIISAPVDKKLYELAQILQDDADVNILIGGHADRFGPLEINSLLSLQRARTVAQALHKYGIQENRLAIRGFGSWEPFHIEGAPAANAVSRGLELVLIRRPISDAATAFPHEH